MQKANPAPGFNKYPQHRVEARPASARIRVIYEGELIAETREAVELHESTGEGKKTVAPVVYYFPRKDVRMDRLARSSHRTHCPFKGDASYFSVVGGPENAVWSYEAPYDEMLAIKERLAFYPDKFQVEPS
jgi:uncharacterized protein (DUF427 family)